MSRERNQESSISMGGEILVTWIDVARSLSVLEPNQEHWKARPSGLRAARVDWRGITFTVIDIEQDRPTVLAWLARLFPLRVEDGNEPNLILDGPPHSNRLSIEFETEDWPERYPRANLGAVESDIEFVNVAKQEFLIRPLPIIACHSVKGGTGRTITAVATAPELEPTRTTPSAPCRRRCRSSRPQLYVPSSASGDSGFS